MTIQIKTIVCGPIENNVYIVFDPDAKYALVIDPSFEPEKVTSFLKLNHLLVNRILITHAHFDHYYGVPYLLSEIPSIKSVLLNDLDLPQWQRGGGALHFMGTNLQVEAPLQFIKDGESIAFSSSTIEVRHAPGHSIGSVIYYFEDLQSAFVGDVIFYHGVGRTDLDEGDEDQLLASIHEKVLSLPDETILYPGHGPTTTVAEERINNPFLQ